MDIGRLQHLTGTLLSRLMDQTDFALDRGQANGFLQHWGADFADHSFDRRENWQWPNVGTITADPRTYHADIYAS